VIGWSIPPGMGILGGGRGERGEEITFRKTRMGPDSLLVRGEKKRKSSLAREGGEETTAPWFGEHKSRCGRGLIFLPRKGLKSFFRHEEEKKWEGTNRCRVRTAGGGVARGEVGEPKKDVAVHASGPRGGSAKNANRNVHVFYRGEEPGRSSRYARKACSCVAQKDGKENAKTAGRTVAWAGGKRW